METLCQCYFFNVENFMHEETCSLMAEVFEVPSRSPHWDSSSETAGSSSLAPCRSDGETLLS